MQNGIGNVGGDRVRHFLSLVILILQFCLKIHRPQTTVLNWYINGGWGRAANIPAYVLFLRFVDRT